VANNTDDYRLVRLFLTLGKLADEDVLRVLAFLMAETLEAASGTVEALGSHLGVDMTAYWQPDEAFFDLLRDKQAINAMLADIAGKDVAAANIAEPVRTQKRIIRDFLAGTGRPKVEDWLPGYMTFPFRAYTSAGGGALQGDSERMQSLLNAPDTD
jgi:ParB family chromosome partitioning protein